MIRPILPKGFLAFFLSAMILGVISCSSTPKKTSQEIQASSKESNQRKEKPQEPSFSPGPNPNPVTPHFVEKAEAYGLKGESATQLYAVDFNNDGFTDLVTLPQFYSVPRFFRFNPKKSKFERLSYFPLEEKKRASYLGFFDFNRDGVLDLLMGTLNQKSELKKEPLKIFAGSLTEGKISYELKNKGLGIGPGPYASVAVIDVNLDGFLDLYVGNWYQTREGENKVQHDHLLLGEKDFKFRNITSALEGEKKKREDSESFSYAVPSFGVSTCDLNLDGYPDILVSASSGEGNKLWIQRQTPEGWFYEDFAEETGFHSDKEGRLMPRGGGNSFYSACADYNNDGIYDLALGELSHAYDSENRDRSAILTGKNLDFPPQFIRSEYYMEQGNVSWNQGDRRGVFFDYNRDGLIDLLVDNSGFPPQSRLILFKQLENHGYNDVGEELGIDHVNPSGTIVADVNRDGRPDIISGQSSVRDAEIPTRIYLYENQTPFKNRRSIRFVLKGDKSNLSGLGATVTLKTQEWISRRWYSFHYGPLPSQNEIGVQFGFQRENAPLKVEVLWPALREREGEEKPFSRIYSIREAFQKKSQRHIVISLCENGDWKRGTKGTCE